MAKRSTNPNDYAVRKLEGRTDYYGRALCQPTETEVMRAMKVEKIHRWVARLAILAGAVALIWWLVAVVGIMTIVLFVWGIVKVSWMGMIGLAVVVYLIWVYNSRETLDAARTRGMKADE